MRAFKTWAAALLLAAGPAAFAADAAPDAASRQLAFDIFKQLINIDTSDATGSTTPAAQAMAQRLLDAGLPPADVQVLGPNPSKGNLVARLRGSGKARPILMICHLDVVEARREDWNTDPYQFIVKDGYAYGRGTQDVKSGCAILVATLIRFKQEGYVPDRDLIIALTADEEGGPDNGVDWLVKHHRDLIDAEYVLNPDAGGVDAEDGRVVSVQLGATEKLYADFVLGATGTGGHSSLPVPDNAIYRLSSALQQLQRSPFPVELNPVTRAFFERMAPREDAQTAADLRAVLKDPPDQRAIARLSADPRYNATLRTTCVPTRLQAGHANNALPQTATALVNCRILPGHSAEEVRQDLVQIVDDARITVRWEDNAGELHDTAPDDKTLPPPPIKPELLNALDEVSAQLWPGAPVIPEMETGASDGIYTNAAGMPTYGVSGVAIDRDDVRAHGRDERLRVDAFYGGLDFYGRVLRALTTPAS